MKIKTRFAPSPTGYLHIGSVHTALYSWLFAKKNNGKFILRIEDTDIKRSKKLSVQKILSDMKWLNLDWDEGPYFQSKRYNRYNEIINYMLSKKIAYKCYCSKKRLENIRKLQIIKGYKPRYDGYCLNNYVNNINKPYVVRFLNPKKGKVIFKDLIRGYIKFNNKELDDLIIRRIDGSHTYNFCVVVDDFDMGITHIIRGEDHINNTPRQINIFKALGASIPIYAHVSIILDEKKNKLSKRNQEKTIHQFREDGFLKEAILNYLACVGWSYKNKEIFSIHELIKKFKLNSVSNSSSNFDIKKLLWYNHYYINNLDPKYIAKKLIWYINKQNIDINNGPNLVTIIKLLRKRFKTLKEIAENCKYFFKKNIKINLILAQKYFIPISIKPLELMVKKLNNLSEWTPTTISLAIKQISQELNLNLNTICMPLRLAITGSNKSPEINLIIYTIGYKICIYRINNAINYIYTNYCLYKN